MVPAAFKTRLEPLQPMQDAGPGLDVSKPGDPVVQWHRATGSPVLPQLDGSGSVYQKLQSVN